MSPVIQATGRRIVHNWVWLHLMLTFACSGQPLPTHCSTEFTTVLRGSGNFRVLATWRSDSALSSESSENARQWHFIRAEGSSKGSWRSRRALQPTCRSRRALEPTCRSRRALEPIRAVSTVVPFLSSGTHSSSTHCLWMRWARNQCFVIGCPEQVQHTMMDGHVCKAVWCVGGTCR